MVEPTEDPGVNENASDLLKSDRGKKNRRIRQQPMLSERSCSFFKSSLGQIRFRRRSSSPGDNAWVLT